jgi:hypothetical protein
MVLTANGFEYVAGPILRRANRDGVHGQERDFRTLFGLCTNVCSVVWNRCDFPTGTKPKHLLWALLFLKVCSTEPTLIAIVGDRPNRKTFRTWVWGVIRGIAAKAPAVVRVAPVFVFILL